MKIQPLLSEEMKQPQNWLIGWMAQSPHYSDYVELVSFLNHIVSWAGQPPELPSDDHLFF